MLGCQFLGLLGKDITPGFGSGTGIGAPDGPWPAAVLNGFGATAAAAPALGRHMKSHSV